MMVAGYKVVVSAWVPTVPKVRISPDFTAASDDCIKSMNQFLLNEFGTRETCLVLPDGSIVVSPKTYATLKAAA